MVLVVECAADSEIRGVAEGMNMVDDITLCLYLFCIIFEVHSKQNACPRCNQ
jgi:hypothetical protein